MSIEAFCANKLKEYELMNSVLIDAKLDQSEKIKEIIKFCNPSQKLVNKILVIAQDEHTLCLHLMKIYGEIKMSFPFEILESYSILSLEEVEKFRESLQDFKQKFIIKLTFMEQINWEDMILVFLNEKSFKSFELIYHDFNENRQINRKKFSLQDNKSKIQNSYKEKKNTIWTSPTKNVNDDRKQSLLEDVMHNTLRMNALIEHLSSNKKENEEVNVF